MLVDRIKGSGEFARASQLAKALELLERALVILDGLNSTKPLAARVQEVVDELRARAASAQERDVQAYSGKE